MKGIYNAWACPKIFYADIIAISVCLKIIIVTVWKLFILFDIKSNYF